MDTEAAAILLALERNTPRGQGSLERTIIMHGMNYALQLARAVASKETLDYVAIHLALENGRA